MDNKENIFELKIKEKILFFICAICLLCTIIFTYNFFSNFKLKLTIIQNLKVIEANILDIESEMLLIDIQSSKGMIYKEKINKLKDEIKYNDNLLIVYKEKKDIMILMLSISFSLLLFFTNILLKNKNKIEAEKKESNLIYYDF